MKKIATIGFLMGLAAAISAQTTQEISTGSGYQLLSFVNLTAGTEHKVANTAWDIAFTVFGQTDAGVFINEGSASSMGSPLPTMEVYDALTDNFIEEPDPATVVDFYLLNTEKSWTYGAFNERRNPDDSLDYGWGTYDPQTGAILGNAVYVLKLRNGQYRKIKIESLVNGIYTFKYAKLDGSNAVTKTINKADHAGKTLAYFSLETNAVEDVEPSTGGFDLLYGRYITLLLEPGTQEYIPYYVTGVLTGHDTQVAEADGVNPATVGYADYKDSLRSELDVMGHDWKYFSGSAWSIDADRLFFLKDADDRVWKLRFTGFGGSFTGTTVLEKTDLGLFSAVQDPASSGLKVALYPNPVQDHLTLALDIPAGIEPSAQLKVLDLQGRVVLRQSVALQTGFHVFEPEINGLVPGTYFLNLQLSDRAIPLGKISKP